MQQLFILILSLILCGCCRQHIQVQTSFLNRNQLASYHVETPDPTLAYPLIGQRLLLHWALPDSYFSYSDLHFKLTIRFRDRSEIVKIIVPKTQSGDYLFELRDELYLQKQGILSYKVEVIGNDAVLETWKHQLWVELIHVGKEA